MYEYLTDKALRSTGLRTGLTVTALVFAALFGIATVRVFGDGEISAGLVGVVLTLLCCWPVVRTVREYGNIRRAEAFSECFVKAKKPRMGLDELRRLVPGKAPVDALRGLIRGGYLCNCSVDLEQNVVLLYGPGLQRDEAAFAAVECPSCGATSRVQKGRANRCEFCGTALAFPGGDARDKPKQGGKRK